jgi:hypothetical protein
MGFLSDLHAYGIYLFLHQQGLDTTTPSGRMMFQMLGVFAEFERAMIRAVGVGARQGAGQDARKATNRGREGSCDPRRFASGQGRHHEARSGARRRSRDGSADQGGIGGLTAGRW